MNSDPIFTPSKKSRTSAGTIVCAHCARAVGEYRLGCANLRLPAGFVDAVPVKVSTMTSCSVGPRTQDFVECHVACSDACEVEILVLAGWPRQQAVEAAGLDTNGLRTENARLRELLRAAGIEVIA